MGPASPRGGGIYTNTKAFRQIRYDLAKRGDDACLPHPVLPVAQRSLDRVPERESRTWAQSRGFTHTSGDFTTHLRKAGKVVSWVADRRFGFVESNDDKKQYFIHSSPRSPRRSW